VRVHARFLRARRGGGQRSAVIAIDSWRADVRYSTVSAPGAADAASEVTVARPRSALTCPSLVVLMGLDELGGAPIVL
jgi:hypothetical protein